MSSSACRSVLIVSRGERLGELYAAIARDLMGDTHVAALIDETERHHWQGLPDIETLTFPEAAARFSLDTGDASGSSATIETIRRIESETGLRLYQSARNYLLYARLHRELFGWLPDSSLWQSEDAIAEYYLRSYRALRYMLDRHRPAILLLEAPDHIYASLAQAMAYKCGVLSLGLYFAPLSGSCSMFLYSGFQPHNVLMRHYWANPGNIPEAAWLRGREMIAKVRTSGPPTIAYVAQMSNRSKAVVGPMLSKAVAALASPQMWSRFGPKALKLRATTLRKELWLKQHLRHDIPNGPFVLYYMQHQPEASLTTQAPHLIDQSLLIEQIAVNAPAGWRIVVKEHPRTYPGRGSSYFKSLTKIPNVHLCHPSVSSRTLLERATAIVTLTGSVGMEALFAGKPVAVIGRPYYSFYPGVMRLERPGDLFDALEEYAKSSPDDESLERFAAAYYASVFDAGELAADGMWPVVEQGGRSIAAAVSRHLELMQAGALRAADFPPTQR